MTGMFVTFEGSEGAGKSTQIERLRARLAASNREVCVVREPGGTALGEDVRHILKHAEYGATISDEAELLLFAASRAQLAREVIRPALEAGKVVICDRFADSTTVYQGFGRGLSREFILKLNAFATGGLVPGLTVLLNLPAVEGLARAHARVTTAPDRMEALEIAFYDRVCAGYRELAATEPGRFFIVNAQLDPDVIEEKIWQEFQSRQC